MPRRSSLGTRWAPTRSGTVEVSRTTREFRSGKRDSNAFHEVSPRESSCIPAREINSLAEQEGRSSESARVLVQIDCTNVPSAVAKALAELDWAVQQWSTRGDARTLRRALYDILKAT